MGAGRYDCCVTFMAKGEIRPLPARWVLGWTSDDLENDQRYASQQLEPNTPLVQAQQQVNALAKLLRWQGHEVLRRRVEMVVYDEAGAP